MTTSCEVKPKILIVDDDPSACEVFGYFLTAKGCEVLSAADGLSGIESFRQDRPEAVLLDLRIPGLDGLEVLAEFSQISPEVPVIIVSASDDVRDTVQSLRFGAFDFVFKPVVEMDVLWHAVKKALDRGQLLRENRQHRENLEALVEERTAMLAKRSRELELANLSLREEINERKRTELALKSSQERFRSLIESVGTIIVVVSMDSRIIEFNREAEKIGYTRAQALGRSYLELLVPEKDRAKAKSLIERTIRGESVRNYEFEVVTRAGNKIILSWNIERLLDEWGQPVAVVASGIDVTGARRLEQIREEVQRVARHDLKTPLVGIAGFVRLLLKETGLPEKTLEYLNYIRCSSDQMINLLDNTLDLIRMEQAT